jgi:hypothetical protein
LNNLEHLIMNGADFGDIPAEKVWKAIGRKPLFGTHSGKKMQTFFGVLMKFEEAKDD